MTLALSTALRTARAQATIDAAGANCKLKYYDGTRPASGGAGTTLLATLNFTSLGTATGGVLTLGAMDKLLVGDVARITLAVSDMAGAPADPGAAVLRCQLPDGSQSTPSVVRDSAGNYHADVDLTQAGVHRLRWEATAPYKGATEGEFLVARSTMNAS